jgi:NhaP-type Na+/H+ or K+/H+ antiporter
MTTDQILLGVGLTLSLAVGSQILASRLRIPALIVLLPVGFVAGALTEVVNPDRLLGPLFEPLVSLAVAVILFDSGLGLDLRKLQGHTRRVVRRLIVIGVPVTWAGGAVGIALLWLLLRRLGLAEVLGTQATIATVVAVAAAFDIVREDTGLIAAIVMGLGMANLPGFDVPARRPLFETVIQLIIGVLFISISATVTPDSLKGLVLPTLGLVAVLVLVARPLVALASTLWTDLSRGERGFIGWMAPRGIVAASTASTFSATLVGNGIGGAGDILPVTFLVIVITVTLYGLTAEPAARLLGVTRPARTRPLLVGGLPWVVDLGRALKSAGLDVLMWAGVQAQRDEITKAGLELAPGELLAAATSRGAELEGVTAVLLLTGEDDFNALASTTLHSNLEGPCTGCRRRTTATASSPPTPGPRCCSATP